MITRITGQRTLLELLVGACVVGEQWRIAEVARTYVLARGQRERALGTVGEPVAAVSCSQSSERTPPRLS